MLSFIINSKSKSFLAFCLSFLAGIFLASLVVHERLPFLYFYLSFFIFVSLFIIFWKKTTPRFLLFCSLFFILAIFRYTFAFPPQIPSDVSYYNGEKKTVTGYIVEEPDVRIDSVRYVVEVKSQEITGRLYVKSDLYPRYLYGDLLEIECKLAAPEPIESDNGGRAFRYDRYLARLGVFSLCQDPLITKIGEGEGSLLFHNIYSFKNQIAARVNELWHEPYAGFMAGLLYGYRGGLGSLDQKFSITGVSHIVAISGYNISLIATLMLTATVRLWIPRKKAFWLVVSGIVLFVILTGASASVVRAGVMGIIVLLARQLGRLSRVGNIMVLTAVLMNVHNPFVLMWDAGFQLSFLATLGLVYLNPILEDRTEKFADVFGLKETLLATISAIIITLPLMLYQFGRLSIVAPLVNVLILWLIPWIMTAGFISVLSSLLFYPLGEVIAWLAFVGMRYITFIVEWFASLPFASVEMSVPWWGMVAMYLVMIRLVMKRKSRTPMRQG